MARAKKPATIVRQARDLVVDRGYVVEDANRVVVRALLSRLASARGLPTLEWPALPHPVDADTGAQFTAALADLDLTEWDVPEVAGVYEQLLHPELRGKNGTYYTPESLADFVSGFSLEVQLKRLSPSCDPGSVLNALVVDPACGFGVLLVSAARRIATLYAERLFGEADDFAFASVLPSVLSESIFGMDIDPIAVDAAKASLWFLARGELPITYMDRNIVCCDTLTGPDAQPPKLAELLGETPCEELSGTTSKEA